MLAFLRASLLGLKGNQLETRWFGASIFGNPGKGTIQRRGFGQVAATALWR